MSNEEIRVSITEIPKIREALEKADKEIERLNNKIDKAIEFINDNSHSNIKMNFIDKSGEIKCKFNNNTDPRDLLDILKGSDKE